MRAPGPKKLTRALAVAGGLALGSGCGASSVVRVMDGHVVVGPYVPERAYAYFLAGALAEAGDAATGKPDLRAAFAYYEGAARIDPKSPEVWVRIGRVRCQLDKTSGASDLDHALRLDASYEPALAAQSFCAQLRTSPSRAFVETDEPPDPPVQALSPEAEPRGLEALTLLHGDRVAAWQALAAWGVAHGDTRLAARGLTGIARLAPGKRLAVAAAAVTMAGEGHVLEARPVAGALLDAPGDRSSGGEAAAASSVRLIASLALDDALLAKNVEQVKARCAKAHVGLEVAAGRAWAMGDMSLARDLVALTVKADPTNLEAKLVHEGADGRAASYRLLSVAGDGASLSPEVALPFAWSVVPTEGAAAAHRVLVWGIGTLVPAGDPLLVPLAVELAVAGALPEDKLPPDGRIELAARRGVLPSEADVNDPLVDARHRLLGLALLHPEGPAAASEASHLASAGSDDPLTAVALARLYLSAARAGSPRQALAPGLRARLESVAAADPLAAAVLVDLAQASGPPAALSHARQRLAALAKTPAERARTVD